MEKFWESLSLQQMSSAQWEALCDGCGKCCLLKLEDEDNAEVYYTNVSCKLLDLDTCRCKDYAKRKERVPHCLVLSAENIKQFPWLPATCAYRLVFEGKDLPTWHHLVSGANDSVLSSGNAVRGRAVTEEFVHPDEVEDQIIFWVDNEV